MGRAFGFISLLIVLCVGAWLYTRQAASVAPPGAANMRQTVDVVGVKNDLLAIANAERGEFALNGTYLPLDDLRSKGVISLPREGRGPYTYYVDVSDTSFRAVARYSGPSDTGAPQTISVDETMQVAQE